MARAAVANVNTTTLCEVPLVILCTLGLWKWLMFEDGTTTKPRRQRP